MVTRISDISVTPPTPAWLLARCAAKDAAAFRQLHDMCAAKLRKVTLTITRHPDLAAEALQEALIQIWTSAALFDPGRGSAEAWMVSIARYRALDIMRGLGPACVSFDTLPDSDMAQPWVPPTGTDRLDVHKCLRSMEADRRVLVVLSYVEGFTAPELAAMFGKKLGTVKSQLRRSLTSMRQAL